MYDLKRIHNDQCMFDKKDRGYLSDVFLNTAFFTYLFWAVSTLLGELYGMLLFAPLVFISLRLTSKGMYFIRYLKGYHQGIEDEYEYLTTQFKKIVEESSKGNFTKETKKRKVKKEK